MPLTAEGGAKAMNSGTGETASTGTDVKLHKKQKGGSEKLTDDVLEETLDKVVKLLAYISDKDLFAEFYRKKLSRRLLFDRSASDDHERSILTRLKQQCGAQFTSKVSIGWTLTCVIRDALCYLCHWRAYKG